MTTKQTALTVLAVLTSISAFFALSHVRAVPLLLALAASYAAGVVTGRSRS